VRPLHPFTPEWAAAFQAAINTDSNFRDASKGWIWTVAFVLNATPLLRAPRDVAAEFSLDGGHCPEARGIPAPGLRAAFVLRPDSGVGGSMAGGNGDPVLAVASRQIKFTGSVTELMLHAGAARALVACAQRVPTWFPDDH